MGSGCLCVTGGEGNAGRHFAVERDLEGVHAGPRQRHVEHQYRARLDVHNARGRLAELDRALATEQLGAALVHKADPDRVNAYLGPPTSHSQHQMSPRTDRGEIRDPDMLKDAEHTQLALLVDEGVIGDEGEIEMQLRSPGWR